MDKCAWWHDGNNCCAIVSIAVSLHNIDKDGIYCYPGPTGEVEE